MGRDILALQPRVYMDRWLRLERNCPYIIYGFCMMQTINMGTIEQASVLLILRSQLKKATAAPSLMACNASK